MMQFKLDQDTWLDYQECLTYEHFITLFVDLMASKQWKGYIFRCIETNPFNLEQTEIGIDDIKILPLLVTPRENKS